MRGTWIATGALALVAAAPLGAQDVGHPPNASPFRDLVYRSELTLVSGWYGGSEGIAGVGPRGGPMAGLRYEMRIGGPAYLVARLSGVQSERTVLDPAQAEGTRDLGTRSWPIALADVGIALSLTGQKSWHHLVPVVHGGIGVASDFGKRGDPDEYEFGTPFAFSFGAGVKYVGSGRLQLRADIADHVYQLDYPDTYFIPPANVAPILSPSDPSGQYVHNLALTLGVSYLFFR